MSSQKMQGASQRLGGAEVTRIPVMLCIDIEPDEFSVEPHTCKPWHGYELTHAYFRDWRAALQQVSGRDVHFNWFIRMDPQVELAHGNAAWCAERYASFLTECIEAGDELGIHVHTYRWCEAAGGWLDDHGQQDWVSECLQTAVDGYRRCFGKPARSLRFGNYWSSTHAINQAEALGLTFDLTVEPGLPPNSFDPRKPPHSGPLPDYYHVPREPYAPSRQAFRRKTHHDDRKITLIPLTSARLMNGFGPAGLQRRILRCLRSATSNHLQSATSNHLQNQPHNLLQDTPLSMWRCWRPPNSFSRMIDRAIEAQTHPYLAFAIHSNFPLEAKTAPLIDRSIRALASHSAGSRFAFCTPSEAMAILKESAPDR